MPFDPATLKYDAQGLIPCIAQDADTGDVLMLAWMNAAAVAQTLATGRVTYWSRSRAAFWVKGESSGHIQELVELRLDCDRDGLLALVRQTGPACHTNRRSCFYTAVRGGDVLVAEDGSLVRVIAAPQAVLKITHCPNHGTPYDLIRAAYHLGNRHVPIELKPDHLKIEPDHVLADMLRDMHMTVVAVDESFEPENGAYGEHGGGHHHGHAHDHDSDHGH